MHVMNAWHAEQPLSGCAGRSVQGEHTMIKAIPVGARSRVVNAALWLLSLVGIRLRSSGARRGFL